MGFGGGKAATGRQVFGGESTVTAPAYPSYAADTTAMEEQKSKAQKALLAMKGRQSTILTGDSTLGTPEVGKRTLLGA